MNAVSPKQIELYGTEINEIANKLMEQLNQIEADLNTINNSIEKLKSYDKQDASEITVEPHYGEMSFSLGNVYDFVNKTFKHFKYIWDVSVSPSDTIEALSVIKNTKESISSLNLSGEDLNAFAAMLSNTIFIIENEILKRRGYKRADYSQYDGLTDLFNTIKDNDIWNEYKDTAKYSKELKEKDLLYNKYRTKDEKENYVDFLLDEIGNHRMITDNDNTKYAIWFNRHYGMLSYSDAFCAAGVSYTLANSGNGNVLNPYVGVSSCASDAKSKANQGIGEWHSASDKTYQPKRGDIFFNGAAHTGIVLDSDENYMYTIEANTSSDDSKKGYVNTRIRTLKDDPYITNGGFYSPPVEFSNANDKDVKLTQDYINNKLAITNGGNE